MKIKNNFKFILLFGIFLVSSIVWNPVLAQIPPENALSVNINTPSNTARVPSGELTIYGTSSDDDTKNCQVYADWNDLKPMQKVTPDGPKGNADYSKWSYTYTGSYHTIVDGWNELTSKITCYDQAQNASSSQFYSINVTGTTDSNASTNDVVQLSDENTSADKKDANILPAKDAKASGTYKILPLYSESNEKVTNSDSSQDGDKTEVTTTDTSESQATQDSGKIDGTTDAKTLSSEQQQGSQATTDTSESQAQDSMKKDTTANTKTLSSEQQQGSQATDTSESQAQDSMKTDTTADAKTLSSEQQQGSDGTSAYEMSKPHVTEDTNKELSTDTNKYFTFEPNLHEDQKLSDNDNNPMKNKPDSDSSLANHYDERNSVFGLKMKDLNEDTKNKIESKLQELKDKLAANNIRVFGMPG